MLCKLNVLEDEYDELFLSQQFNLNSSRPVMTSHKHAPIIVSIVRYVKVTSEIY